MNTLAFHTTNTGEVAGGMEGGNGSGVNGYLLVELRKVGDVACA